LIRYLGKGIKVWPI